MDRILVQEGYILHGTDLYNLLHYFHYMFYKINAYIYRNHINEYSLLPGSSVTYVFCLSRYLPTMLCANRNANERVKHREKKPSLEIRVFHQP